MSFLQGFISIFTCKKRPKKQLSKLFGNYSKQYREPDDVNLDEDWFRKKLPGCRFIGPIFVNVATDGFLWHGNQTKVCAEGRFLAKRKEAVKLGLPSSLIAHAFGSLVIKIRTIKRVEARLG